MSETHTRGAESPLNLITGEPPGIKEILERRAAEGNPPEREETQDQGDDADRAAREVASLKRDATEANARAAEAERRRAQAERGRQDALQASADTGFTAINTALAAATREKESLTGEMKAAGESGDFGRMAEISTRLGELGAEIRDLSQGKTQFEQDRQTRLNTPREPQIEADTATERNILTNLRFPSRNAFLETRTDATKDFLRQHPEFFTDLAAHQRMVGADALARGRGLQADTPEYFDTIREAALGQTERQTERPTREREAPPGAPPTRQAPGPSGRTTRSGDVYVSQEDKIAAEWMGVDPVEYTREKESLRARGEYPYRRR